MTWDKWHQSHEGAKYPAEDLVRWVEKNWGETDEARFLEIGCGCGSNLMYITDEGFDICGVETSQKALKKARKLPINGSVSHQNAQALTFENCYFDAIIDNECVYSNNFDDSRKIYLECLRVLKPGGKMFVRSFAPGTWEGAMVPGTYFRFSAEWEMRLLLTGLEIEHMEILSRTVNNMKDQINEWIIWAKKPE